MSKLAERNDIPSLDGWINLTEAAERLGYTRSYMYKLANKPDGLQTLHRIGTQASYVVAVEEIDELIAAQAAAAVEPAEKKIKAPKGGGGKVVEPAELSLTDMLADLP